MTRVAFAVSYGLQSNRLFDISSARDGCLERFVMLRKALETHALQCDTVDACDTLIDVLIPLDIISSLKLVLRVVKLNPTVKILYNPCEEPTISCLHESDILGAIPFDRVLYWNDDFVQQYKHAIQCNIGQPMIDCEKIPTHPFQEKKFMVAITSSKLIKHKNSIYQERFNAFDFFSSKLEGMDLYGVGWDTASYSFVQTSYRGICDTKKDVLQHYKFSICFENSKGYSGDITEKIFDCFAAGTVPIYYGAPNVQDYIPKACFIDFRGFADYEELYQFLIALTEADYQTYLDAVKGFIKTPAYYEFTSKRYAEVVLEQVQAVMQEPKTKRTVLGFKWSLLKIVLMHPLFFVKYFKACRRFLFDLVTAW